MIRIIYLFVILCITAFTFKPSNAQNEYVGSSQFFDISGEWVNKDTVTKRISRVEISPTIVNTYRMVPYFALGDLERPFDEVKLSISEELMCYETRLLDAQCMIMPMKTPAGEQLRVYSIIVDPNGSWTGVAVDVLHKTTEKVATDDLLIGPSFDPWTLEGSWMNEWEEDMTIPRFNIFTKDNELYCQPYKLYKKNNKIKAMGEYKVENLKSDDGTQLIKWEDNGLVAELRIRPIMQDWQVTGIDMIVEEVYDDGTPKKIYRQFFIKDPDAEIKAAAEKLIATLDGNWENIDPSAATLRLNIFDSEIRVWVNCQDEQNGCSLGTQKVLEPIYEGLIGTEFTTFSTNRTLEIDTELEVNPSDTNPNFMVLTTVIEDIEGMRPIQVRSEVFKRKGHIISGEVNEAENGLEDGRK
ncbi:MAG: hypothetical protein ACPG49_04820 [Chitinophagales bacterium]